MTYTPSPRIKTDSDSVKSLFDGLAERYDRFNRLASLGLDGIWRRHAVQGIEAGMRVLDVGTGTGDLAFEALKHVGDAGEVVGLDFSHEMLRIAEDKRQRRGLTGPLRWVERSATEIPFEKKPYDVVISGFVLRNIFQHIDSILSGVFESLKSGGNIRFLDITEPDSPWARALNRLHFKTLMKFWGWILFRDNYPVTYLESSIGRFLKVHELKEKLESHGFVRVESGSFLFGIVTLYTGAKP